MIQKWCRHEKNNKKKKIKLKNLNRMLWRKINCVIMKKKKMKNKLKLKIEIECYCILELVSSRKKMKNQKTKID